MDSNPALQRSLVHSQPSPQTPQEAPKRRFSLPRGKLLAGLIIVSLTVIAAFLGYYYYNSFATLQISDYDSCAASSGSVILKSYPEKCLTSDGRSFTRILSPDEQAQLNPSPTPDVTSTWSSFSLGSITLKIPPYWIQDESATPGGIFAAFSAPDGTTFEILVSDNSSNSLTTFLATLDSQTSSAFEGSSSVEVISSQQLSIGKNNAIQRRENLLAAGFQSLVTYVSFEDKIYSLSLHPLSPDTNLTDYNQILSTFEFLDPSEVSTEGGHQLANTLKPSLHHFQSSSQYPPPSPPSSNSHP